MIHLEQAGQPFRVILTEFQAVDQPQQPFQQGMAAPEEAGGYGTAVLRRQCGPLPAVRRPFKPSQRARPWTWQ